MDTNNKYSLIFTKRFTKELKNTYAYLNKKLMKKIDDALMQITLFPKAFSTINNTEYRKVPIKRYIIIYKFNEKNNKIHVLHIYYSKSNYITKYFNRKNLK